MLAACLAMPALPAQAQPAEKVARIGYLAPHSPQTWQVDVLRQGLRDLGWAEGRNLIIDYRSAEGRFDRLPALAAELAALKVQVIVAVATVPALAAKRASDTIPIVFTHVSDPVGSGIVSSLARPGANVTGFTHFNAVGLGPKRVELLRQVKPGADSFAALWHPGGLGDRTEKDMLKETADAARALGLPLQFVPVRGLHELEAAFASLGARPLVVLPSPIFRNAQSSSPISLPSIACRRSFSTASSPRPAGLSPMAPIWPPWSAVRLAMSTGY